MHQNQDILKVFVRKGFLLDKETLEFFSKLDNINVSEDVLNKIFMLSKGRVISKAIMANYFLDIEPIFLSLDESKKKIIKDFFNDVNIVRQEKKPIEKKEIKKEFDVKILSSNIIPYRKIEVKDFVKHFKNRYNFLKDILKERRELVNLVSIDKIGNNRDISVIGMVISKRITKNKNLLLEIEDLTGRVTALINHDKEELFEKAKEIVLDDIIGFKCGGGREILYVNDIFFPDAQISEKKKGEDEIYSLFISDIHVGSTMFLEKNFTRFIEWLNGKGCSEDQKNKIDKIKYLFIVGDSIDGVGIFPGQEDHLKINNAKDQYKKLSYLLKQVPKHINIIMCPGQHDAVRVPEPQPPIDEEFAEEITKMENVYLVSNPALIEIGAGNARFKVLMYHGASMTNWVNDIEELRTGRGHDTPAKVVKHLLRHRHLSPTHSGTAYVPGEIEDSLVIKEVPDVIATGDFHRTDIDMYNNILIVCSSCWQSITPFEEKVGNNPDPCKVPILNLKTREIKILDFSDSN